MYIIQLICQPRLFAADRLSRCIKVTGCPPRENVQGNCVLDAFKTSSDINKTLIQTSSGTGKAKKQNVASKDNFSSLNRFIFHFGRDYDVHLTRCKIQTMSLITHNICSELLVSDPDQRHPLPSQIRINCCSLCSAGTEVCRSCSKGLRACVKSIVCVIYLGKMEINGICTAAMKHVKLEIIFSG